MKKVILMLMVIVFGIINADANTVYVTNNTDCLLIVRARGETTGGYDLFLDPNSTASFSLPNVNFIGAKVYLYDESYDQPGFLTIGAGFYSPSLSDPIPPCIPTSYQLLWAQTNPSDDAYVVALQM